MAMTCYLWQIDSAWGGGMYDTRTASLVAAIVFDVFANYRWCESQTKLAPIANAIDVTFLVGDIWERHMVVDPPTQAEHGGGDLSMHALA